MADSQPFVEALGQAGASHQIGSWTWPMELGCEQSRKHPCLHHFPQSPDEEVLFPSEQAPQLQSIIPQSKRVDK
jgi:hypothetical protein